MMAATSPTRRLAAQRQKNEGAERIAHSPGASAEDDAASSGRIVTLEQDSLSSKAASALSDEILSGRIGPGERIDLGRYAATWNVSVTPLRDAAKQLESIGLLRILPRRGIFVSELNLKGLRDIFDVRLALECVAVRLATPRIPMQEARYVLKLYTDARGCLSETERMRLLRENDRLVHVMVHNHCGNPRLQKILDGVRDLITFSQRTLIARGEEAYIEALPEHISICEAICARDPDRATAEMQQHLENSFLRIDAVWRSRVPAESAARIARRSREEMPGAVDTVPVV